GVSWRALAILGRSENDNGGKISAVVAEQRRSSRQQLTLRSLKHQARELVRAIGAGVDADAVRPELGVDSDAVPVDHDLPEVAAGFQKLVADPEQVLGALLLERDA